MGSTRNWPSPSRPPDLEVIEGGHKGSWQVAGEGMIIDMIGMAQIFNPKGISLSGLQKVLDRVREGKDRVDYYALKRTVLYLENDGRLIMERVHVPNRGSWDHWRLTDWEEWWRIHSRLIG